jgi:uncharacterized membrane protein (DUF485 family)
MDEEKKVVTPENKEKSEEESDFADEAKPVPAPEPAVKPVEEKPENKIDLHAQKETPSEAPAQDKKPAPKEPISYTYNDPLLKSIEDARLAFYATYKKGNLIKWIVTAVVLAMIIAGWLVPTFAFPNTTWGFYVTLGVVVVAIAILGIYSFLYKKKMDVAMKEYFAKYYEFNNQYVFGDKVTDLVGTVDDKLDPEVFKAAGLYKDVLKVGSRETLHFNYHGQSCIISDCAGQVKGEKALQTVFVGKLLVVPNDYQGPDCIIYLKGNKRALPPTTLDDYDVLEDSHTMVIYGSAGVKRLLTHAVRQAIAQIQTNDTFVDLAISVKAGKTYFAMGFEDNLMVLPLEKPFNPAPTEELKADTSLVLGVVDAFQAHSEAK